MYPALLNLPQEGVLREVGGRGWETRDRMVAPGILEVVDEAVQGSN